ncbi:MULTISPECIES: FAD-dependent oxidoreductase [Parachlamydia]|uniref:FAD-dependent oxidoreductase n=1 Tax=Parachlamydia TaxID=83551 RepID=UPI00030C2E77|nr:FAD-dependent monooxygenase [Parachlamydia acanthamoebae]
MTQLKNMLFVIFLLMYTIAAHSTDVLIIGGGPSGLGTAIEAYQKGMNVRVVEKEKDCLHAYWVFLTKASLSLLDKWKVTIPEMTMVQFEGKSTGLVQIKYLNRALKNRVKELGIERTLGKFIAVDESNFTAEINTLNGKIFIPYDFIVAADGSQSHLRKQLGMDCDPSYQTVGAWAFFPFDNSGGAITSEIIDQQYYYIRRILLPGGSAISLQGVCYDPKFFSNYTLAQFRERLLAQGWTLEAEMIRARNPNVIYENNMSVFLQKAQTFSNKESRILLVGEAAASATFFDCIGLNTALQSAVYAGDFFSKPYKDRSYKKFNQKMEAASKQLLDYSAYLFSQCAP